MSVYYVHAPDLQMVKIGYAQNPLTRLNKMRADSPTRLVLLAVEDGGRDTEAMRHAQFVALRRNGEWFRFEGALAEHVGTLPPFVAPSRRKEGGVAEIAEKAGISRPYASMLLSGQRASIEVLLHVFKTARWKHPRFQDCDEATLLLLAERFPYEKQSGAAA